MKTHHIFLLALGTFIMRNANAQSRDISLDQALQQAMTNNKLMQSAGLQKQYQEGLKSAVGYVGKTDFGIMVGQYNSFEWSDNSLTLTQSIPHPKFFKAERQLGDALISSAESGIRLTANELSFKIKEVYYTLLYLHNKDLLLIQQDSIYSEFLRAADLRLKTGETNLLEKTTAQTQLDEIRNLKQQNEADMMAWSFALQQLTGSIQPVSIVKDSLQEKLLMIATDTSAFNKNPMLDYLYRRTAVAQKEKEVIYAQRYPDFRLGYFNQTLKGNPMNEAGTKLASSSDRFMGFNAGVSVAIFNGPLKKRYKAAEINHQIAQTQLQYQQSLLTSEWNQAIADYEKNKRSVNYYRSSALKNADLILYHARTGFREGQSAYTEYLIAIRNAVQIRENYLVNLNKLNQAVIRLEFLAGQ